ncbi:iron-containing alcohol dehydrogenase [Cellulomonas xiejunii]|uniref:iron-containing alcohol dehydrogenase n=1 Tax=Cellulomonas xiejunii TaxID=2968083 RepID=UPI001D0EA6DA|nr:iron-containing alcohol dehydrogenase [Cellulomonas xiejunii]MCC2314014.1 iron-containing alcohol dehydrogenase [Cellulomonas xiejunii]
MTTTFHLPTRVILGRGAVDQLGQVVRPLGSVALVLLGASSARRTGAADRVVRSLQDAGVRTVVAPGVSSNPCVDQVDAARATARREGCDVVVAVGGGSVIDAGKVVGVSADVESSAELLDPAVTSRRGLNVVAVPTIAGSGAEVTKGAILSDTRRAARGGVRGAHLFPEVAVVDPDLQASVPASHAVAAAFDCLTHAIEALVAVGRTPFTDELAGRVVALVADRLGPISRGEATDGLLDDLALASVMGGMCVANASTCLPHRLQQAMGAVPEILISHGQGLAAVYPAWLAQVQDVSPQSLRPVADALGTQDVVEGVSRLLSAAGLHHGLSAHGFRSEHLPRLVAGVTGNLGNDPSFVDSTRAERLLSLYERSLPRLPIPRPAGRSHRTAPTATESRTP